LIYRFFKGSFSQEKNHRSTCFLCYFVPVLEIKAQQRPLHSTNGIDLRRRMIASEQFISSYTRARLLQASRGPLRCKQHLESLPWFISARVEGLHRFYRIVEHAVCASTEIRARKNYNCRGTNRVSLSLSPSISLSIINRDTCAIKYECAVTTLDIKYPMRDL